jgi:hypothetical protein
MPSRLRNKATTAHPFLTPGMTGAPATTLTDAPTTGIGRGRTAQTKVPLQFLSLPRDRGDDVIGTVSAASLVKYVNLICSTEFSEPGFVARNPEWAYNMGAQILGTE